MIDPFIREDIQDALKRVEVTFAWWFDFYVVGLAVFCALMGTKPDMAKFAEVALRASRFRIKRTPQP